MAIIRHGNTVHLPPVLTQPIATEDVASAVAEAALAELVNDTIEIAGPDAFTLAEAINDKACSAANCAFRRW